MRVWDNAIIINNSHARYSRIGNKDQQWTCLNICLNTVYSCSTPSLLQFHIMSFAPRTPLQIDWASPNNNAVLYYQYTIKAGPTPTTKGAFQEVRTGPAMRTYFHESFLLEQFVQSNQSKLHLEGASTIEKAVLYSQEGYAKRQELEQEGGLKPQTLDEAGYCQEIQKRYPTQCPKQNYEFQGVYSPPNQAETKSPVIKTVTVVSEGGGGGQSTTNPTRSSSGIISSGAPAVTKSSTAQKKSTASAALLLANPAAVTQQQQQKQQQKNKSAPTSTAPSTTNKATVAANVVTVNADDTAATNNTTSPANACCQIL